MNHLLTCGSCNDRKFFLSGSGKTYVEFATGKQLDFIDAIRNFLMLTGYALQLPTHPADKENLTRTVRMFQWGSLLTRQTVATEDVLGGIPVYGIFTVLSQQYVMLRKWLEENDKTLLPEKNLAAHPGVEQAEMARGIQELLDVIASRPNATELEKLPASFGIYMLVSALNNW